MRKLIFSTIALFLISLGVAIVIVFNTNPQNSGSLTIFAFFLCLWLSLLSVIFIIFSVFGLHGKKRKWNMISRFRRSVLIASLFVGLLILSSLEVLNFLSGFTLVLAGVLSELFFVNRKLERSK